MIDLELARQLREAGLVWHPAERDNFVIPDRGMDTQVFVVSQLTALIQMYNGSPVVSFFGTPEWALDYVMITDVIWLPTESQLREMLARAIGEEAPLRLDRTSQGYRCQIASGDQMLEFSAAEAESAYGLALLQMLNSQPKTASDEHEA